MKICISSPSLRASLRASSAAAASASRCSALRACSWTKSRVALKRKRHHFCSTSLMPRTVSLSVPCLARFPTWAQGTLACALLRIRYLAADSQRRLQLRAAVAGTILALVPRHHPCPLALRLFIAVPSQRRLPSTYVSIQTAPAVEGNHYRNGHSLLSPSCRRSKFSSVKRPALQGSRFSASRGSDQRVDAKPGYAVSLAQRDPCIFSGHDR